jgi:aspartate racemase
LLFLNRGKIDQEYPLFILYNKSNIPGRPESIGVQTRNLSNKSSNNTSKKKYNNVLKSLLHGCKLLEKINVNLLLFHAIQLIIGSMIYKRKLIFL